MIVCLLVVLGLLDDKSELLAAAKKSAEAKSYTVRGETRLVLPAGLDKSGGQEPARFEAKVDRDAGAWMKTDAHEFVTVGGKTVSRPVSGWRAVREEGADVQRLLYQALAGSRAPRPLHDDLAAWPRAVSGVRKSDKKERVGDADARIYDVDFKAEYARDVLTALLPMGPWMDNVPLDKPSAAARVWVGDGRILKLELSAKASTSLQGAGVEMSATRTMSITDHDATKVNVPEEARKMLEAK